MLAFAVLAFLALLVVLFVLDFGVDLKPGVLTKIKTLLTHFQVTLLVLPSPTTTVSHTSDYT